MLPFLIAAATALQVTGSLIDYYSSQAQANANRAAAIHEMNSQFQNWEAQRHSIFDSAIEEISTMRLHEGRLQSAVQAAVADDLGGGGNTADMINRSALGDEERAVQATQENYRRQSDAISINEHTLYTDTQRAVNSMEGRSLASTLIDVASAGISGFSAIHKDYSDAVAKGYKYSWKGRYRS